MLFLLSVDLFIVIFLRNELRDVQMRTNGLIVISDFEIEGGKEFVEVAGLIASFLESSAKPYSQQVNVRNYGPRPVSA